MSTAVRLLLISVSWVTLQIGSGYATHRMPLSWFTRNAWLYRVRRWERDGETYQRVFRIRRWKDLLPEAGAMFSGGISKKRLGSRSRESLLRFIAETRRAELTHWLPILLSISFFAWNPPEVALWMPLFGLIVNLPFIAVQRYIRPRITHLVGQSP